MNVTDVISFFQQPEVINFVSTYLATSILNSTISSVKNVIKEDSLEYQIVDALGISLLKTCEKFKLEYDSSAIVETFLYTWNQIKLINSEEELKKILIEALGCEVDQELFEYWALQFQIESSNPKRMWLNNFINTCGLYKLNNEESLENTVDKVVIDLSVIRRIRKNLPGNWRGFWGNDIYEDSDYKHPHAMKYAITKECGNIKIYPEMEYLMQLKNGGPIKAIGFQYVPFRWEYPVLDFKLANNGKNTVILTGVQFDVKESRIDPTPIIVIDGNVWGNNARHIKIVNDGWGKIRNLKLHFNVSNKEKDVSVWKNNNEDYRHHINVGSFFDSVNVDLTPIFKRYKVKSMFLDLISRSAQRVGVPYLLYVANQHRALGAFEQGYARVYGIMDYFADTYCSKNEHFTLKFITDVWLFNTYEILAMLPPSQEYEIEFASEGENYLRELDLSHSLVSQETDRLTIKIGMPKSSTHKFDIKLIFNTGDVKTISNVYLWSFVSRLGSRHGGHISTHLQE